jgi:Reverse transcriptase (RNA-dependent DNA polymerase)
MFFGLCNSPATFQRMMNDIFANLIAKGKVTVYLDDILITTSNLLTYIQTVIEVLNIIQTHNLYLKPEKCNWIQKEVEYLGHIILYSQIQMDHAKTQAVDKWKIP